MLSAADLQRLRALNFGFRTLNRPLTEDVIAAEIRRYDPAEAAEVSRRIRATAGRDEGVDALRSIHREVVAEFAAAGRKTDAAAERAAFAAYVRRLGRLAKTASVAVAAAGGAPAARPPRRRSALSSWLGRRRSDRA